MSDAVEVAIVGAGPYGLSLAAHLRAAGVSVRQFGLPMQLWKDFMPEGMYPQVAGLRVEPVRPRGHAHARGLLPGDRAPLRQLRPAGSAGHVRRLRRVVPRRARARHRRGAGHRHHAGRQRVRADPGQLRAAAGAQGGRRHRRRGTSRTFPSRCPRCRPRCARTARPTPTWAPSRARRSSWSARASPRWSPPRCCTRRARASSWWPGRPTSAGTASRWPWTGRRCSGSGSRSPGSARAGPPGSTPTTRTGSGTCRAPPGSTGRARRSARPGRPGCARGWRGSSPPSPATRSSGPGCRTTAPGWG